MIMNVKSDIKSNGYVGVVAVATVLDVETFILDENSHFEKTNKDIRESYATNINLNGVMGQRFIGSGLQNKNITINGTPGNALASYMNGASITVYGNAQDATGDTMNEGSVFIHGSCGDACGYAMRGGKIYVRDNVGYRCGIHMKAYKEKSPVIIIGGGGGSFLGEYQAGGLIIVLGLGEEYSNRVPVGDFCGTGMHGGKIIVRSKVVPQLSSKQVSVSLISEEELQSILPYLKEYSDIFSLNLSDILNTQFFVITADTKNPYKRLYAHI